MKQGFLALAAIWLSFAALPAHGAKPSVLYVGTDPAKGPPAAELRSERGADRLKELYAGRMPAFKALLERNFDTVKVIDAALYTPQMSDLYDVTIFDALPPELPLAQGMTNERSGGPMKAYLPRDFSRPAIVIGVNGYEIGAFLGLKINMHCPCLDAQAHGMKLDHEIFNTPVKVKLTLEQVKTPENYQHYYSGRNLGAEVPMWRVQTEGYKEGKGMPVGLVSTGPGFEDSPDAEVISNGVNTKAVNSVAIARHGNFFMWGFWADPSYMTAEAKQVFVNAVYYIRKFDKQVPFVRVDGYKFSRDFVLDLMSSQVNDDLHQRYQDQLKYPEGYRKDNETDFLASMFRVPREVAQKLGFDGPAYLDYQVKNLGYLHEIKESGKMSRFEQDPDVRAIGIPNWDVKMLDTCVSMLEKNDRPELARRLLTRYTDQTFTTAVQWRKWLDINRKKLFFTDLGGFKFLVYPTEVKPASRITQIS